MNNCKQKRMKERHYFVHCMWICIIFFLSSAILKETKAKWKCAHTRKSIFNLPLCFVPCMILMRYKQQVNQHYCERWRFVFDYLVAEFVTFRQDYAIAVVPLKLIKLWKLSERYTNAGNVLLIVNRCKHLLVSQFINNV